MSTRSRFALSFVGMSDGAAFFSVCRLLSVLQDRGSVGISQQPRLSKTRGMKSTVSIDLFGLDLYTLLPVAQFSFEYAVEIFGEFS